MSVLELEKPTFQREQIVSATTAAKRFAEVRHAAKKWPQFISDHNEIDTVILNYDAYEKMYMELQRFREQQLYATAVQRIEEGDADSARKGINLQDVMNAEEFVAFQKLDADAIADEELFA